MRYFTYARKSSESEDRQVQSIDDQLSDLRKLADGQCLTSVDELSEAKSAKAPGLRPVFDQMLDRVQAGEADGILCWNMNRLFRNSVDYGRVAWLLQQGIIKSVRTMDREYLPEDNVLLMAVEAGVATQFVIDLRKAVLRGMESRAAKGWYPARAPLGYLNNRSTNEIEVDPATFPLLRQAWELILSGTYTVPEVLERLRSWGVPSLARSNLYKVFNNPFYYGSFRWRGSLYPGNHQPLVTRDEFDRAQALIHRPNHIQPKRHDFAFTGLMRCGVCGCLITADRRIKHYKTTGNTRIYVYYHCTGSKGCSTSGVREEYVEERISALLAECRLDPAFQPWAEQVIARETVGQPASLEQIERQQRQQMSLTRQRLERLLQLRLDGEIGAEEYQSEKVKAQNVLAELSSSHQKLRDRDERIRQTLANCVRFATTAYDDFADGSPKTKRAIATALSNRYVLTQGRLEIEPHPLLDRIRTFEPLKRRSQQVQAGVAASESPLVCSLLDNMRNLVAGSDMCFDYAPLDEDGQPTGGSEPAPSGWGLGPK